MAEPSLARPTTGRSRLSRPKKRALPLKLRNRDPGLPARATYTFVEPRWAIGVALAALGCGMSGPKPSATGGTEAVEASAGTSPGPAQGATGGVATPPDPSRGRTWSACGTVPGVPLDTKHTILLQEQGKPGDPLPGHPFFPDWDHLYDITALAMSADGRTLVSMGGAVVLWDVKSSFAESTAVYLDRAIPEWPNLELSPDGQWLAISGDGMRILSRAGERGAYLDFGDWKCWPASARFSPDGRWFTLSGLGEGLTAYAVADFRLASSDQSSPVVVGHVASLPAACGPVGFIPGGANPLFAFAPDSDRLITETGDEFSTEDWRLLTAGSGEPSAHGLRASFEVASNGQRILSSCEISDNLPVCTPYRAPSPKLSADGRWVLSGGTLTHLASGATQVLDPSGVVGIFTPNGDAIVAGSDSSLTRYCLRP